MPTKEENIADTRSHIEKLRTANLWATALGSAVAGAFGGLEAAGTAAKTTTKIIGDEYDMQLKELGRQESLLEEERRTNAMMANQIKLTKLQGYMDLSKTQSTGQAMATAFGDTAQLSSDLAQTIASAKNKKQVDDLLKANVKTLAMLSPAQQKDIMTMAENHKIAVDKSTGVGMFEKMAPALQESVAFLSRSQGPVGVVAAEELKQSAAEKRKQIKAKEASVAEKKRKGKELVETTTTKSASAAASARARLTGY